MNLKQLQDDRTKELERKTFRIENIFSAEPKLNGYFSLLQSCVHIYVRKYV